MVSSTRNNQITLQDVLEDHPEARRSGNEFKILCPCHDDHDPSLSILEENGRLKWNCHAGCDWAEVGRALGVYRNNANSDHVLQRGAAIRSESNGHSGEHQTLWPTAELAQTSFEGLLNAKDAPNIAEFLKNEYGLTLPMILDTWRELVHPQLGNGIAYRGEDAAGNPVYKWRSIARNAKGKREARFLYGKDGAIVFEHDSPGPLVLTAGEEKGVAAWVAGFDVISFLSGEKPPSDDWIKRIIEGEAKRVIIAFDADETGKIQAQKLACKLELSGYPASKIGVIQWPDHVPQGHDLNDLLKAGGCDAVRDAINSALTFEGALPRCLSASEFLAVDRPPLAYHIQDLLPVGGKLTFSATSKFGKSMWAIQTGMALAAGNCELLGWKFGSPARVLYLQAEIMDSLLEARLKWLLDSMPVAVDRSRAGKNFIIQEIAKTRPNLMKAEGKAIIEALLRIHKPDVLILDPLATLHPGLEENAAESMGLALDYISDLTLRFRCAVILVHHHSKAGAARGSSVFEAWPESDLQASFISDDDRSTAKVIMRLRCAYNPGPIYLKMPTPESPWFERMPEGWQPERGRRGRQSVSNREIAVLALRDAGKPLKWKELREVVMNCGVSQSTAERIIREAKQASLIEFVNDAYSLPANAKNNLQSEF